MSPNPDPAARGAHEPGADPGADSFARALGDAVQPSTKPSPPAATKAEGPQEGKPVGTPGPRTDSDADRPAAGPAGERTDATAEARSGTRTDAKAEAKASAADRARNNARAAQALDAARERRAAAAAAGSARTGPVHGSPAAPGEGDLAIDAEARAPDDPALPTDKAQAPAEGLGALLAQLRATRAALPAGSHAAAPGSARDGADTGAVLSAQARAASATHHRAGAADGAADTVADAVADTVAGAARATASALAGPHTEGSPTNDTQADFARQLAAASGETAAQDRGADTALRLEPLALPLSASAGPQALANAAGAAPVEVQLPASPGSADFGPQFSTQVTTFVRDGIEHARLHLNPAEMGPVSVQIQLDGATALVHLSADNAETRQALEQALPQLAGSLREAGLTLTGGGVFEQPRQGNGAQGGADDTAGRQRRGNPGDGRDGSDLGIAATERSAGPARRRGVVDLVA